jgi:DNA replication and repair protein RecF
LRVVEIALQDFRNYRRAHLELSSGVTLVVGSNAQGKTNLLEGVYCLSGLGSPRAADAGLVRDGAERGFVHGKIARAERSVDIDIEFRPGRGSRVLINKTPVGGTRMLKDLAVSVYFGPDDLALVKGPPERRRRFLDDLAIKLRPARDELRREWDRVLKQRNALLRSAPRGAPGPVGSTLAVWDEAMCRLGARIAEARLETLSWLAPLVRSRYEAIAGGDTLRLEYESAWLGNAASEGVVSAGESPDEASLREALADKIDSVRSKEFERGVSLAGPHRDDVIVCVTPRDRPQPGLDARSFASQGEQRSAALALKLGEYELLGTSLGERPVLLLDDVFSELDQSRRAWLADAVRAGGQVVLSSAEPAAAEPAGADRVVEVEAGQVRVRE